MPSIGHRVPWYFPIASVASVTMRIRPPTRRSTSHSGMVVFSGPHHDRSCSAPVSYRCAQGSARYARLSSANLAAREMHLTNFAVQKKAY